jgi:F-type H+-transporting ATPase subunit epsilon
MYHLAVVTPEKVIFEDEVKALIAPGKEGSFEILTNHASMMTLLKQGDVVITTKDHQKVVYAISGGFLQVSRNQCTLLADSI